MRRIFLIEAHFDAHDAVGAEERIKEILQRVLNEAGSISYSVRLETVNSRTAKRGPVRRGA